MQESAFQLVLHASFFVKLILTLLVGFSVGSWSIIVYKYDHLRAASRESESFLSTFNFGHHPQDLLQAADALPMSPLARLFKSVYPSKASLSGDKIDRLLKRQQAIEAEKLYAYLTFLAVTGSTTPFIGLLGTVWGIINSFRGIGVTGSASLAVVAPGIAEALITTAAGLVAAIPAVMAYNAYLRWARKMTLEMENFSEQLQDLLAKKAV